MAIIGGIPNIFRHTHMYVCRFEDMCCLGQLQEWLRRPKLDTTFCLTRREVVDSRSRIYATSEEKKSRVCRLEESSETALFAGVLLKLFITLEVEIGSRVGHAVSSPFFPRDWLRVIFTHDRCKPIWLPIKAHRFAAYRAKAAAFRNLVSLRGESMEVKMSQAFSRYCYGFSRRSCSCFLNGFCSSTSTSRSRASATSGSGSSRSSVEFPKVPMATCRQPDEVPEP